MLQSPRLSYHPISPIDAAFNDEVDRRVSKLDGAAPATSSPGWRTDRPGSVAEEVSPIDHDDIPMDNRISFVSMPSLPDGDGVFGVGDDLAGSVSPIEADHQGYEGEEVVVSPVSPHETIAGGEESPATVSPLESRRESVE